MDAREGPIIALNPALAGNNLRRLRTHCPSLPDRVSARVGQGVADFRVASSLHFAQPVVRDSPQPQSVVNTGTAASHFADCRVMAVFLYYAALLAAR